MKPEVIEAMKEYVDENYPDFEIDYDDDELKEIKKDYQKLADEYISLFQEFRQHFKNYEDDLKEKIDKFIEAHNKIYYKLREIMMPLPLHKYRVSEQVKSCVMENEVNIASFFYMCLEVYE